MYSHHLITRLVQFMNGLVLNGKKPFCHLKTGPKLHRKPKTGPLFQFSNDLAIQKQDTEKPLFNESRFQVSGIHFVTVFVLQADAKSTPC